MYLNSLQVDEISDTNIHMNITYFKSKPNLQGGSELICPANASALGVTSG